MSFHLPLTPTPISMRIMPCRVILTSFSMFCYGYKAREWSFVSQGIFKQLTGFDFATDE